MTKNEFKNLQIGDCIKEGSTIIIIRSIDYEYDFTTEPPTDVPWSVYSEKCMGGRSLRITDNLRFVEKVNLLD